MAKCRKCARCLFIFTFIIIIIIFFFPDEKMTFHGFFMRIQKTGKHRLAQTHLHFGWQKPTITETVASKLRAPFDPNQLVPPTHTHTHLSTLFLLARNPDKRRRKKILPGHSQSLPAVRSRTALTSESPRRPSVSKLFE